MRREQVIFRLACVWILVVVVGSLQPARPGAVAGLHREIHWLAFAVLAFLLLLASRNRRQGLVSVAGACLLGFTLESLQHFIFRSAMEWVDVREDALAILTACVLFRLGAAGSTLWPRSPGSVPAEPSPNLSRDVYRSK